MQTARLPLFALITITMGRVGFAADVDQDGIDDALERNFLDRFAPILVTDQPQSTPSEFRAIPVNAAWFPAQCDLRYQPFPELPGDHLIAQPTVDEVLNVSNQSNAAYARGLRLDFNDESAKWGGPPYGHPTNLPWSEAISRGEGAYGRVWRPFPSYPNYYSVQYYVLLTWNESGDCDAFNDFRHDGDIICLDYGVSTEWGPAPVILHAIYHVHGERSHVTRDALQFSGEHPYVFLERGSQEPWPNAGTDGRAGWPDQDGWAFSDFLCDPLPEWCCIREHRGQGTTYPLSVIANLGEAVWGKGNDEAGIEFFPINETLLARHPRDAELFLKYRGGWGSRDPVRGPAFQPKMWERAFDGPWGTLAPAIDGHPLRPDLSQMGLIMNGLWGPFAGPVCATLPLQSGYLLLPNAWVRWSHAGNEIGWLCNPFNDLPTAVARIAPYGDCLIEAGSYQVTAPLTISKPMRLEAQHGPVTIGQ